VGLDEKKRFCFRLRPVFGGGGTEGDGTPPATGEKTFAAPAEAPEGGGFSSAGFQLLQSGHTFPFFNVRFFAFLLREAREG
jgi:hypothetical protein